MLHLRANVKKLMPYFIQDFGVYSGNMSFEERSTSSMKTKNDSKVMIENNKNLILEYFELVKKIDQQKKYLSELESEKMNLSKKIMGDIELRNILEEVMSTDANIKAKK